MELKFIDTNKIFRKQSNNESPYFRIEKAYTCKKLSSFHISTAHSSFQQPMGSLGELIDF